MSYSHYSRDSSGDEREHQEQFRENDEMHARRAGNMPAPLRKKKNEETYKRFITPTGDPMTYVRQHMRSRSLSDIQVENAAKEEERDARNVRYEEMQELKVKLKEEEDTWTSKLDNWKQRRRSATLDVRRRKEDRDVIEQHATTSSTRRPKTYKEMVEEKKRRELGLLDGDSDHSWSVYGNYNDRNTENSSNTKKSKKMPYRGAISVPNIADSINSHNSLRSPSPSDTKVVVTPVKYTSKVTAVIDHVPTTSEDSSELSKIESPRQLTSTNQVQPRVNSQIKSIWPPPPREVTSAKSTSSSIKSVTSPVKSVAPVNSTASPPQTYGTAYRIPIKDNRQRVQSPPASTYSSKTSVAMRNKSQNTNKERPKSAYSTVGERASTLPRNYHSYSKASDSGTSSFVQHRKNAFANKRSMWENIGHQEPEAPRAAQHLASLLQHDTEKLHGSEPSSREKPIHNGTDVTNGDFKQTASYSNPNSRSQRPQSSIDESEHKPRIIGGRNNSNHTNTVRAPWLRSEQPSTQTDSKPSYHHASGLHTRASWNNSATLPTKARSASLEERVQLSNQQPVESTPSVNGSSLQEPPHTITGTRTSPRSPANTTDSLFDDMKICINQRPKSEKGFGFTVRGGDEGRPVIVNTVSPGLAADICQLCVGDEILAINDVKLSSSLTQDGIVQLIVDSVITGSLSLDIRRYGKMKKSNSMRLSGTKVVMTSGGFVQVRSDKGKSPVISTRTFNGTSANNVNKKENYPDDDLSDDLPPPPDDLIHPKKLSAMDRLSPKKTPPSSYRRASPLSNLIGAAKSTTVRPQDKENNIGQRATRIEQRSFSPRDSDDDLQFEVMKAQHDLDVEESYLSHERRQHDENLKLREQLLEEQRLLEEREVKREEEKRRRIEEAKAEEMKVEEELRRIQAAKQEQQKRREKEKRRLVEGAASTFGNTEMNHWLIEEAERSRLAEEEGRQRMNALDYSRESAGGGLPDHVIQRLSQRGNPNLPGTLREHWNDPGTHATML